MPVLLVDVREQKVEEKKKSEGDKTELSGDRCHVLP